MGRNARRRAEHREEDRAHGLGPEEEKGREGMDRCPRCGSHRLVTLDRMSATVPGVDVVCLNCNWQGQLTPFSY